MPQFVQSLESRRLLSVTVVAAEAALTTDVHAFVSDAKSIRTTLVADGAAFAADLKTLKLSNGPLKTKLVTAVAKAKNTVHADVTRIINAGFADGQRVLSDVLHIYFFDASNPTKLARDQVRLAADVKALSKVETPLLNKLSTDVDNAQATVGAAAQAIVTANPSDLPLQADWMTFANAFVAAKTTLTTDFTNIFNDLDALSTAT